jgi:hypothetical protein
MEDNPFSTMVSILDERMQGHAQSATTGSWLGCELGTMTGDMGLKLDNFKHVIHDYLLSHHLMLREPDMTNTETDGAHSQPDAGYGGAHSHQVVTPVPLLPLHPGDRVLAMPVNGGQDFVIVARVVAKG